MENPPSSPNQPQPKKLKMSTTNTSDDDDDHPTTTTTTTTATTDPDKKPRYKRRKIAIFFAYCGVGYQGMQKNPGAKTIEGDLEEALFFSGAVPEPDRGLPKRFDWARSARTDKGVSAVGQVVSGRFYIDPPGLVNRLNSNLSPQIRIFGYKRVTASFNAKKFCDRRRYVYLIPVFALNPSSHPDRESVLASLGSDNELVKCLECSERGRKVEGVMGNKRNFEPNSDSSKDLVFETVIETRKEGTGAFLEKSCDLSTSGELGMCGNGEDKDFETGKEESGGKSCDLSTSGELGMCGNGEEKKLSKESEFCYGEKDKERFNRILKLYEGTHNFHNFTTRTKAEDPSAKRYIVSFDANTVVTVEGIDFVKCEVVGQSFMLHQIRKMVGVAIAIMRNCALESLIETALQQDVNINVPTAPEVGLYLDECFFASYNQKWKDTHEELSMKDYAEEAEDFKMKNIYSHIAQTEHKEGVVALWLHSLNHRNYPDLRSVSNGGAPEVKSAEADVIPE